MADVTRFLGGWTASRGAPYSNHTFTWEIDHTRLRGRWVIEASDSPAARAATAIGRPMRLEMQVDEPSLEGDALMFQMHGGPALAEFRLVGPDEAIVGAAMDRLPPELDTPAGRRSVEGHRVRLVRAKT